MQTQNSEKKNVLWDVNIILRKINKIQDVNLEFWGKKIWSMRYKKS